jgi:hypothetical protein
VDQEKTNDWQKENVTYWKWKDRKVKKYYDWWDPGIVK